MLCTARFCLAAQEAFPAAAVPVSVPPPVLTNAIQVLELPADQLALSNHVRLRGVMTFVDPGARYGFVQDETAGAAVFWTNRLPPAAAGQLVEMEGRVDANVYAPTISRPVFHQIGPGEFPKPLKVSFPDLWAGRADCQWVEVDGLVRSATMMTNDFLVLEVAMGRAQRLGVSILSTNKLDASGWVNSRVRIHGVACGSFNSKEQFITAELLVPSIDQVTMLAAAPSDPYSLPLTRLASLGHRAEKRAGEQIHIQGVATLLLPGEALFVRQGTNSIEVRTSEMGGAKPGDQVDVVGFYEKTDHALIIEDGSFRRLAAGPPPIPLAVTMDEIASGRIDAELVTIPAKVLEWRHGPSERAIMLQGTNHVIFKARLNNANNIIEFPRGSRLRVTGVCLIAVDQNLDVRSFELRLRSAEDLVLLQRPAWWTPARILWVLGALAAGVATTLGWVWFLKRANVRLERRVAERTAELAKANLALQVENAARKRIGEQLRVQATALDAAANAIVITDHHGAILSVNPAFTALTGYTAQEAAGQNPRFLKSGKQGEAFYRNLWQTISAGQVWRGELTNRRKDGSLYHEEMTITPLRNPDGTIARYIAIKHDISERKRAEEELKFKSVILSTQQEVSIDGILVVDENGAVLSYNRRFVQMWGIPAELIEKKVDKLLLDFVLDQLADAKSFLQRVQYLYQHRREINREEILLKDGRVFDRYSAPMLAADDHYYGRVWSFRDITARQQAEEKLKLFRALIERSNEGIYVVDPATGRFLDANESAYQALGYTRQELLALTVFEVAAGVDRAMFEAGNTKIEKTGHATMEVLHRRKDGTTYPVEAGLSFVTLDRTYQVAIVRDITQRKQLENAVRASEQKFKSLFEDSRDAIMTFEPPSWKFTCGNPAAIKMFGAKNEEDFISHCPWDLSPERQPDGRASAEKAREMIEKAMRRGSPFFEWTHRRIGGEEFPATVLITRMQTGEKLFHQATVRDITASKQAEAARDRMIAILESTTDMVGTADPDGRCTYLNRAGRDLLGMGPEQDISTTHISEFHAPDGAASAEAIATAVRQGVWRGETVLLSRGGKRIPVSQVIIAHKNPGGKLEFISTVVRDISGQKKVEAEMENIHKQLVESSRLAGMAEIATNVLHNVGNALNSVNISTDLIVDGVKKSRASSLARIVALLQEHAHHLGEFMTSDPNGRHVPALLARLSEHLAAEQGKITGELDSLRRNIEHVKDIVVMQQNYASVGGIKEKIDLAHLVEDSLRLNEDALSRHGVKVVRQLETVPLLNLDKHKILQILVNLVRNAKYACDESGRADRRLTVRLANGDGRVRISVMDDGIGIPPENLTRMFNYGFTTRSGGHGFGLHSSALAAKEMGGALTVQSGGPSQGATFTLELPCPTREKTHA